MHLTVGSSGFVEITVYRTERGQQDALVRAVCGKAGQWVRLCPGFVSSRCYKSEDGTRVVVFAEWRSRAEWGAFIRDSRCERLGQKVRAVRLATPGDGRLYRAAGIVCPPGAA